MEGSDDLGRLDAKHWDQLQEMASRFEAAWKDAETVDLTSFLPPADDPLRRVALQELIKSDLEARWRRGQIIGIEAYLEKYPELGNVGVIAPSLVYEEYRVRHLHGDKPPLDGYKRRFPRQFPELQRLVRDQPLPDVTLTPNEPPAKMNPFASSQHVRIRGGDYKLVKQIGCGGFAEVWQAETPGGFPVAIKRILRPLEHAEAQLELRALGEIKQLRHSYLLQTRDYDLIDNHLYIVMDLADCTLSDRLKQCAAAHEQGIPLDELLRYIHEAAEAIDYMHRQKVHHRDIKPKNILLLEGHAKVADFGLARMVESQRLTVTGSGTAPYMAPEVWKRQVSAHSDQYSLAVSYAELRLGRMPFASTDMYTLMIDHIEGRPNLDGLPEAEQQALRKALAKDPAERYPNCTAFVEAIEQAVENVPVPSGAKRRKPKTRSDASRPPGDTGTLVSSETPAEAPTTQLPSDARPRRTGRGWRGSEAPRPRWWIWVGVLGALLFGLAAWKIFGPFLGRFEVEAPDSVILKAGGSAPLRVRVRRTGFDAPIRLSLVSGPAGVTTSGFVEAGADEADVPVRAEADAEIGEGTLTVRAEAEGRSPREFSVPVTVVPAYWKLDWYKAPDAKVIEDVRHRRHWSRILVDSHGISVPFVLIPQLKDDEGGGNMPTFYIMENKVWNQLYAHFADRHPEKAGRTWEKGAEVVRGTNAMHLGWESNLQLPALHMTVEQAHQFAAWLQLPALRMTIEQAHQFAAWLGGRLPSARQWDKASGYYEKERGKGPFRIPPGRKETPAGCDWQPDEIAINRADKGPMSVGTASCDESSYGCRDMAGNGCEWTRDLAEANPRPIPLLNARPEDNVTLRGKGYHMKQPWLFRIVDNPGALGIGAGSYLEPKPYIGFRVVIELD
jgi:serine/threonine protein kinase